MIDAILWKQISRKTVEYKFLLLILFSIATAFAIPGIFKLHITVDIEDFFLEDDPVRKNQDSFEELFDTKNFVGVLVESGDVFSRETLNLIKETSHALETKVPFAEKAISIITFSSITSPDTVLTFEDNILQSSDKDIEHYKQYYSSDKSLSGTFFSADNSEAWILLPLKDYPSEQEWDGDESAFFTVGKNTYNTVKTIESGEITLTPTGFSVYAYRKKTEMLEDLLVILIIGLLVACILSIIVFSSILEVFATLVVIGLSVVYVLGIQGWLGATIDSAFISVPILLTMGVGIGYAVHIASFFKQECNTHGNKIEAITTAVSKCAQPIFFTAVTTTLALCSFVFVNIKPIQWVGLSSALCIVFVYLLSMVLFPIIVSFGKFRKIRSNVVNKAIQQQPAINPILNTFANWVAKHDGKILLLLLLTSAVGIYGTLQVRVDLDAKKMTGTRLAHMKDFIKIGNSQIASNEILELVVSLEETDFEDLENIALLVSLEEKIAKLPLVKQTNSLAKQLRTINYISHARREEFDALPKTQEALDELFNFIDQNSPELRETWNNALDGSTRISIELSEFSSKAIETYMDTIETLVERTFPPEVTFFFSGATFQMAVMNQYVTKGLIWSLFTALVTITIIMILIFKSIRIGLIAMIPNVFPVIVAGSIMGMMQIPLEFVTMTVAPLILGLSVDDTIHLIWHLREDLAKRNDFSESVRHTFSIVGKAITQTTVILCFTFLVFTFSKVNNIVYMGIIICSGLFAAYVSDIFVTPILIKKITRFR